MGKEKAAGNLVSGVLDAIGWGARKARGATKLASNHVINPVTSSFSSQVGKQSTPVADLIGGGPSGVRNALTGARDHARTVRQGKAAVAARNEAAGLKRGDKGFEKGPGYFDGAPDAVLDRMGGMADYFMGADLTAKGYGNWAYGGGAIRAAGAYAAADFLNPFSPGWND